MYRLIDLDVNYTSSRGHRVTALKNINLTIAAGEYIAITGPSGSGKSTLLMTLGGMLTPESGSVSIDGVDLYSTSLKMRSQIRNNCIGMVFQTFNLIPYLTAGENVAIPLLLAGINEPEQKERAAALLREVGLEERYDHLPSEMSVGQQQRVALARMLANDPDIILADEPTGSLDPETGSHILDFLDSCANRGKTVILVTHDPEAAKRTRKQFRLEDGRLTQLNG